ncbi:MAG: DUF86 domain-containing protein [Chloroflexota bacterium]|nr:DUF86 domain-containing protein [Chloroflexota bacterium]
MDRQRERRLRDALDAAKLIQEMVRSQTFDGYLSDEWFRAALERKLEIIGEALNTVRRIDPTIETVFPALREWPALRNALSHVYFQIDHAAIWEIATIEIPDLIATLDRLLAVWEDES